MIGRRLFFLLLVGASVPCLANTSSRPSGPFVPAVVRAGQTISLSFPALPAEAEEFELLLSVDGGDSFPLRLTPSLDARESNLVWTVPALPTDRARIRVRWGDGRKEVESRPTETFSIRISEASRFAPLRVESGEIWIGNPSCPPVDRAALGGAGVRPGERAFPPALASPCFSMLISPRRLVLANNGCRPLLSGRCGYSNRLAPGTIPLRI